MGLRGMRKQEMGKQLNEERNDLHSSPNIARVIKIEMNAMGGTCNTYERKERCIQGFGGET